MKHKILTAIGILLGIAVITVIVLLGSGKLFQGALYNLRPIYRECKINGANGNSTNTEDCEYFFKKLQDAQNGQKSFLADGEYTVTAKYTDPKLSDNLIPIRIKNNQMECTYLQSGYKPQVRIIDTLDQNISDPITETREIPVGTNGIIAEINFLKDGAVYPYDDNICEGAFSATVYDTNKKELGSAKLDRNTFISSQPLVNKLLISGKPYYGENKTDFDPGNIYMTFNFDPELVFKFTIPCSNKVPQVAITNAKANKNVNIKVKGLDDNYVKTCGSKLYWTVQNANQADDIHQIDLKSSDNQNFALYLKNIPALLEPKVTFPMTFLLALHIKDQIDAKDEKTLGNAVLTVTGYKSSQDDFDPEAILPTSQNTTDSTKTKPTATSSATPLPVEVKSDSSTKTAVTAPTQTTTATIPNSESQPEIIPTPIAPSTTPAPVANTTPKPKVRHMPEQILKLH